MAKIPDPALLDRPTPRPGGAVSDYRVPDNGGIEGRALAQVGVDLQKIGEIEQRKDDELRAEDALNTLRGAQNELSVGPDGFAQRKGAAAVTQPTFQDYTRKFDDTVNAIASTLKTPGQKDAFKVRANMARQQFGANVLNHVTQQRGVYAEQVYNDTNTRELAAIVSAFLDPNAVNLSIMRMTAAADTMLRSKGFGGDDDASKAARETARTAIVDKALETRFESWMYRDPVKAREAFNENASKITDPKLLLRLDAQLKSAAQPIEVRNAATEIMAGGEQAVVQSITAPAMVNAADFPRVSTEQQLQRDRERLVVLKTELAKAPDNQPLVTEIASLERRLAAGTPWQPGDAFRRGGANAPIPSAIPQATPDTKAMLSTWLAKAEEQAQKTHPNDPIYRDALITEVKSKYNNIVAAQQGLAVQAHSQLTAAAMPQEGKPAPTTLDQLLTTPELKRAWQLSTPESQSAFLRLLDTNSARQDKADPKVLNEALARIHLADGNPAKITDPSQLVNLFPLLGQTGYNFLKKELDEAGGGKGFSAEVQAATQTGRNMITRSILGGVQPDVAEEAAYRFANDLRAKVEQYRKEGKDPRTLLTPGSKDYVLDPTKVASFMTPAAQVVSAEAKKSIDQATATGTMPPRESMAKLDAKDPEKSYNALEPGAWFVAPDGRVGRKRAPTEQPSEPGAKPEVVVPPPIERGEPELVDQMPKARTGGGMSKEQLERRSKISDALLNYAKYTTVGGILHYSAKQLGEALGQVFNTPGEATAAAFQAIKRQRAYTLEVEPIIEDAIEGGHLNAKDERLARTMLLRIAQKKREQR